MTEEVQKSGKTGKGLGISGLIVGAVGLIISFIPLFGIVGVYIAVPAFILSLIGTIIAMKNGGAKVLCIIALVISIAAIGNGYRSYNAGVQMMDNFGNDWNEALEGMENVDFSDVESELDNALEDLEESVEEIEEAN